MPIASSNATVSPICAQALAARTRLSIEAPSTCRKNPSSWPCAGRRRRAGETPCDVMSARLGSFAGRLVVVHLCAGHAVAAGGDRAGPLGRHVAGVEEAEHSAGRQDASMLARSWARIDLGVALAGLADCSTVLPLSLPPAIGPLEAARARRPARRRPCARPVLLGDRAEPARRLGLGLGTGRSCWPGPGSRAARCARSSTAGVASVISAAETLPVRSPLFCARSSTVLQVLAGHVVSAVLGPCEMRSSIVFCPVAHIVPVAAESGS